MKILTSSSQTAKARASDEDEIEARVCLQAGYYRSSIMPVKKPTSKEGIRVIPNPAHSHAQIELLNHHEGLCYVTLHDAIGKPLKTERFDCSIKKHEMDLNQYAPGVYVISVRINSNIVHYHKLIIAK